MKTLRIFYTDFWPEFGIEDIYTPILKKHFNIIIDDKNPDIVFHSVFNRMEGIKKYKNSLKIMVIAENYRPDYSITDFSISFDPHTNTNYRLPLWQVFNIMDNNFSQRTIHNNFERFCSFTVSNPSNFLRNGMFTLLSNYKKVHSYGRYMNNDLSLSKDNQGKYWRPIKEKFFIDHSHKFALVYENNSYPYYCTEKIMDAFIGGSLPIYWGDPMVKKDWNVDALINANRLSNNEIVEKVKELDMDDHKYMEIYNQPMFTDEQYNKHKANMDQFPEWLITIIKNNI